MYKLLNFTSKKAYVEKDINAQWLGLKKEKTKPEHTKIPHLLLDLQVGNSQFFLPILISLPPTSHSFPSSLSPQIQVELFLVLTKFTRFS